jgi:hypothetical protein
MAKPDEIKEAVNRALCDVHERMCWVYEYLLEEYDDATAEKFAKASERVIEQVKARAGKKTIQRSLRPVLEASRRRVCG